jgi:hypothetical protein
MAAVNTCSFRLISSHVHCSSLKIVTYQKMNVTRLEFFEEEDLLHQAEQTYDSGKPEKDSILFSCPF